MRKMFEIFGRFDWVDWGFFAFIMTMIGVGSVSSVEMYVQLTKPDDIHHHRQTLEAREPPMHEAMTGSPASEAGDHFLDGLPIGTIEWWDLTSGQREALLYMKLLDVEQRLIDCACCAQGEP